MSKRIAILTSGGDAPGMNAAIRAATIYGISQGCQVFGVHHGYRGLLDDELELLAPDAVAGITREGGTILGSARSRAWLEPDARSRAIEALLRREIEGVIVIGGNGSLAGARALEVQAAGRLQVVGIPASIDNDIGLTGSSIGTDTALNTIVEACDKISDTAAAHERTFIVEVMGRECGYLAMSAGIASDADAVLFSESGAESSALIEQVVNVIRKVKDRPARSRRALIVKAEGVGMSAEAMKSEVDGALSEEMPDLETRVTILGHVVRGGRPSAFDRILASRLAHVSVRALLDGHSRKMAAWSLGTPIPPEIGETSPHDPHCWLVDLDAVLTETKRLIDGSSPITAWRKRIFEDIADVLTL